MKESIISEVIGRRNPYMHAETVFLDGTVLRVNPRVKYGNVEGFDSAGLYANGVLCAGVANQLQGETVFWTAGEVSQPMLAEYIDAAKHFHPRDELFGRILENAWVFMESLREGSLSRTSEQPSHLEARL
jgi:hypothetical protein